MSNKTNLLKKRMPKSPLLKFFILWLVPYLILASSSFTAFLIPYSYLEIFPKELIFPLIMHALTALIIALVIYFVKWPKYFSSKLVAVFIVGLLMFGYGDRLNNIAGFYRAIIPILPAPGADMPVINVIFLLTIFIAAILIALLAEKYQLKHKNLDSHSIVYLILIIVGVVFISQAFRATKIMPTILNESKTVAPLIQKTNQSGKEISKPDIYYIVLDRYTNNKVLSEQFNYDNSDFTSYLKGNGFYVNEQAYSNYPLTTASISSTLNASYTKNLVNKYVNNPVQSRTLYHNLIQQSSVVKALKSNGYTFYNIGSVYGATDEAPLADSDMVHSTSMSIFNKFDKILRGFEIYQFNQSPYYQFFKVNFAWWPFKMHELDNVGYVRAQVDDLNQLADANNSGGRFIFAHILIPHDPFIFNADGSTSAYQNTDAYGKTVKNKYLDQVKFINGQVKQIVEKIKNNSGGKAVVILNADEGAYPQDMNNTNMNPINTAGLLDEQDMSKWPIDWLQMKLGILQAVNIPKASNQDLANLSSVNVFRIVLNDYLGYQLDYLPNCEFATSNGAKDMYTYVDITQKLLGQDSQYCQSMATN
jgi:hypothetical protein